MAEKATPARRSISENSIIIDLPMPAYLPTDYIPELSLRLQLYRRIGGLSKIEDVESMRSELRDRFGELPSAVEGLLFQIDVKILALAANATHVLHRDENRDQLAREITPAVELTVDPAQEGEGWRDRLIELLGYLAQNPRSGGACRPTAYAAVMT